jgi:catechol 2,3-dioxygenase-like lactoylglutathione lyase family enzyme
MRAKIFFITLAVDDLGRSVAFYRDGLGWPTEGIVGQEFHDEVTGADGTIAFFTLDGGLMLGLYERTNLAKDASLPAAQFHRVQLGRPRHIAGRGRPATHPG